MADAAQEPVLSFGQKVRAYLTLLRVPNLFTVVGDPICGYLVCTQTPHANALILCVMLSLFAYMYGLVLNDYADLKVDLRERPDRPLPSRQIPMTHAKALLFFLLGAGMCLTFAGSLAFFICATILFAMITAYNLVLKRFAILGCTSMALCRVLNILLGVMAVSGEHYSGAVPLIAFICAGQLLYVYGLSRIAREEMAAKSTRFGRVAVLVGSAMPLGLFTYHLSMPGFEISLIQVIFLTLSIIVLLLGFRTFLVLAAPFRTTQDIQLQVTHLIAGFILIQSSWTCTSGVSYAFIWALGVLMLYIPFKISAHYFKAT